MLIINSLVLAIEQINLLKKELRYKTSRSGGKGGQNVNKVETKVEISFNVNKSIALTDFQKLLIAENLKNKISEEGLLKLTGNKYRSQLENKEDVVKRLINMLTNALKTKKERKATKPSKSSKVKKADTKKRRSETKQMRKKIR